VTALTSKIALVGAVLGQQASQVDGGWFFVAVLVAMVFVMVVVPLGVLVALITVVARSALRSASEASPRSPLPPTGWYREGGDSATERYWDGRHWTSATRGVPPGRRAS
jgi:hypothetical protein